MATLTAIFEEVGVSPEVSALVRELLPGANPSDFAAVSQDEFDNLIGDLRVPAPPGDPPQGGGAAADPAPLSLLQRSRLRLARLRAQSVTGILSLTAPSPAPAGGGANTGLAPASKKVKLSSLVDPTAEAELVPLTPVVLRDMFAKYEQERGGPPGVEVEPTAEQLSAIKQLTDAGAPPYVDFALFGPHGRRFLKKLTYVETLFQVSSGTWVRRELPGPST